MRDNQAESLDLENSNFTDLHSHGHHFVDKTKYIEILESYGPGNVLIHRPHGFGKTTFASMLESYYDVRLATRFDEIFAGTYIHGRKTELANRFQILRFDFSGVGAGTDQQAAFDARVCDGIRRYFKRYPHPRQDLVLRQKFANATQLFRRYVSILGPECNKKVCLIIDDYDQVIDAVLDAGHDGTRQTDPELHYVKNFYCVIKFAGSDRGPIDRIFMTGVAPVSLDALTTGFSFVTDVSDAPAFAGMLGFDDNEVREIVGARADAGTPDIIRRKCGGYRFSSYSNTTVFNPSLVLDHVSISARPGKEPNSLIMTNLERLEAILTFGDQEFVSSVIESVRNGKQIPLDGEIMRPINPGLNGRLDDDQILSALFHFGCLTYADDDCRFLTVPNRDARDALLKIHHE